MNPPTLALGATTITLPHPAVSGPPTRGLDMRMVQRRTIGGRLRTTVMSWGHTYRLEFHFVSRTVYDAIRDLWIGAVSAGQYPTFSYIDVFPSAASAPVSVTLSPAAASFPADPTLVDFTLDLEEANPR